jgi:sterol desaturase/sphingolipid hydroxylase (fatty acid hydroxylase superfamily)
LWVNHSVHHYKDGEIVFGVSSPLWDYIYGTMKLKAGEENKNSHSDLGVA